VAGGHGQRGRSGPAFDFIDFRVTDAAGVNADQQFFASGLWPFYSTLFQRWAAGGDWSQFHDLHRAHAIRNLFHYLNDNSENLGHR
jgi:hypothetical protein